jgi:eukaryotic-like serine/threonine-protein kinase
VNELDREAGARVRIGATLKGKWRLEELLGVGGVAAVYAARHKNGKRVAIKILHPAFAADERVVARFSREGYVANRILHPGAVVIDDDDVDEALGPFVVMELCDGETLEAWRVRLGGRVAPAQLCPVLVKLLEVLAAAHRAGVLHRDLKPENVMLSGEGDVKILDFGLARAREAWSQEQGALTQPEALLGTPGFMAPEQAMGRWDRVDARTDLWAVGATAFALLAGRPVHQADSVQALLVTAATEPAPRIRDVCPDVPAALAAIIDRALSFSKAERFESAEEMSGALSSGGAEVTGAPSPEAEPALLRQPERSAAAVSRTAVPSPPPSPPSPLYRAMAWSLGAAALVALVAYALTSTQPSVPEPARVPRPELAAEPTTTTTALPSLTPPLPEAAGSEPSAPHLGSGAPKGPVGAPPPLAAPSIAPSASATPLSSSSSSPSPSALDRRK